MKKEFTKEDVVKLINDAFKYKYYRAACELPDISNAFLREKGLLEPELIVGKWYVNRIHHAIACLTDHKKGYGYGFNFDGNWRHDSWWFKVPSDWRPATDEEVEEDLIAEAKKRGFKEGARCTVAGGTTVNTLESSNFVYDEVIDIGICLGTKDYWFYNGGKWATIIDEPKEMTVKQIEDIVGHSVKIVKE